MSDLGPVSAPGYFITFAYTLAAIVYCRVNPRRLSKKKTAVLQCAGLILINILLLIVGCFMDTTPAMMVLSPILLPVALSLGLSAIHFGIIMVVNLAIGFITPPLGINLFVAARVGNTSLETVCRGIIIFIIVMLFCLLCITYIPAISETLPKLAGMRV